MHQQQYTRRDCYLQTCHIATYAFFVSEKITFIGRRYYWIIINCLNYFDLMWKCTNIIRKYLMNTYLFYETIHKMHDLGSSMCLWNYKIFLWLYLFSFYERRIGTDRMYYEKLPANWSCSYISWHRQLRSLQKKSA